MIHGFPSTYAYHSQIDNPQLRDFLSHVFRQVDVDKYMQIYSDSVLAGRPNHAIYANLLRRAQEAKGGTLSRLSMGYKALKSEKATLLENIGKVIDPNRETDGYLEIAMPGRMIRPLKSLINLKGKISVANEQESLIQSGFPKPYDHFETLTYDPINIEKKSVGMVSCFAGLHHCPEEKLEAFIQSIHSSLKEGGILLVREHDAHNQEMLDLANVIHSVFNSATGVAIEDEAKEVRNFKGVQEWIDLLEKNGFRHIPGTEERLIREGDSTVNALLKFVKTDNPLEIVREKMISQKSSYTRKREQTHLTTVEWFNVESSQSLGKFENFWDYPYFRDIKETWKCYSQSWNAARKVTSFSQLLTSEYTVMNTFIATLTTAEYLVKGIFSSIIWAAAQSARLLPKTHKDASWEQPAHFYQTWLQEYGQRLEITPYYAQKYLPTIQKYWNQMGKAWSASRAQRSAINLTFDRQTLKNVVVGVALTLDMIARAAIASASNFLIGGAEDADDREIALILKGDVNKKTVAQEGEYKGVIAPRYKELGAFLKALNPKTTQLVEIAGQTEIQIDIIADKNANAFAGEKLYERAYLADENKKIVALQVPVNELLAILQNVELYRVCDF
ncbi:MAG: hypothetical protein S4CHLAM123_04780 [Chlamydiales bacterium]|nr:hypothetical protein [Chlamydiales bacterium]